MLNGRTNLFYTEIDFCRSNKALEPSFELASDMLLHSKYSKNNVETEKGVILQELEKRLNNSSSFLRNCYKRTTRTTYNTNTCILGSREEIEKVTAKELKNFREETFVSQNFLITIEGGISYHKAKKLAEKYFIKSLKNDLKYPSDWTYTLEIDKQGNLNIEKFDFKRAKAIILFKLDEEMSTIKNDMTMRMLCNICSGADGLILGKLRDLGLVYETYVNYFDVSKNHGFCIEFSCTNENVNKVIEEIGKALKKLKENPIPEEIISIELRNFKLWNDEYVKNIYPSHLFEEYLITKEKMFDKRLSKQKMKFFKHVTPADIQEFSKKAFSKPENLYISMITSEKPETFYSYEQMRKVLTGKKEK